MIVQYVGLHCARRKCK